MYKWANVKEGEAVAAIATKEHAAVVVEVEGEEEREELDGMQEVLGQLPKRQVHPWNPITKCKE